MYRTIEEAELRIQKGNGYVYFNDVKHPLSYEAGKVYYHRHVASIKLGRWLTPEEHVHHIDGDKTNNTPSNLEVLTATEHAYKHCDKLQHKSCIQCGKLYKPDKVSAKFCSHNCHHLSMTVTLEVTREELQDMIDKGTTWVALGKLFGLSDNGVKKKARSLGCTIPIRKRIAGPRD